MWEFHEEHQLQPMAIRHGKLCGDQAELQRGAALLGGVRGLEAALEPGGGLSARGETGQIDPEEILVVAMV